jgi:diguanylate cyclase (GGDEF)-like protein
MPKSLLIVDDSIPLHKLIKAYLEPDGLMIHSAYDGEAGLAAAVRLGPSLILLDVDMPRIDGFEVCRRLKANPATAAIPVVFLTASSLLDNRVRGLDVGASDYISKPFKPPEFRARIRAALRSRNQLEAVSLVDGSTGLWNRTYLDAHVDYHVSLARRFCLSLSCIVAEVDDSHLMIKKFGEAFAADLFRGVGNILTGGCRTEDVVCRYDAWKFAILATGANRAAGTLIGDRLGNEVQRQLRCRDGRETRITCSFGVADTVSGDSNTLVERADAALGPARRASLDCVTVPPHRNAVA